MSTYSFYIYITTNSEKSVLYIGMTNELIRRLDEHYQSRGQADKFAGRYYCCNLIYWEHHRYVQNAIDREKELKKWSRVKKEALIASFNPEWRFLNEEIKS
ncbi:GIY-YIG nuclease family protein [Spirosoma fluminis]